MKLDLSRIPFSVPGAYLAISSRVLRDHPPGALHLHTLRGEALWKSNVLFQLLDPANTPFDIQVTPGLLTLHHPNGGITEISMPEPSLVRIRGRAGARLRLQGGGGLVSRVTDDRWKIATSGTKLLLQRVCGNLEVDARWRLHHQHHGVGQITIDIEPTDGCWELVIDEYQGEWLPRNLTTELFEAGVARVRASYADYLARVPMTGDHFTQARELAAYVNWSSVVRPSGFVTRPAMLMSKNWMHATWSWDNCFNALATLRIDPVLAIDQLLVVADNAHRQSRLFPDYVSDSKLQWGYIKPPIYGWAIERMRRADPSVFTRELLTQLFEPIAEATESLLQLRDDDSDGAPSYYHGNDSGWDNASAFDEGYPVEGPDVLAFLCLQCESLARMAGDLGRTADADRWLDASNRTMQLLLREFWQGDLFVVRDARTHAPRRSGSLLHFLPLVLGMRLPSDVRRTMIAQLRASWLTEHGLATERPDSPAFIADGYWRGPIWAPPTVLITDGLHHAGEHSLADEIARRFCGLCATGGFAENFQPITGDPLRDPAYTWTSSAFLIPASQLHEVPK